MVSQCLQTSCQQFHIRQRYYQGHSHYSHLHYSRFPIQKETRPKNKAQQMYISLTWEDNYC